MINGTNNARTLVINATNLGGNLDGIGVYTLNLLREMSKQNSDLKCIVYLNTTSAIHFADVDFPDHWSVRWVTGLVSPDHGFRGHLLRLLYAHFIAVIHPGKTIFGTSQLVAILFRRNQTLMVHDIIPLLFKKYHKKQYHYFKYVLPFILRRASAVITPSHHTKELLLQVYGLDTSRVHVIHHGVDRNGDFDRRAVARVDGQFILYTGRIAHTKNVSGVLGAFARVKDKIPHKLVITGHGRGKGLALIESRQLQEYGLTPERVIVRGYVPADEMSRLMRSASALIFPSLYEGFGLPPLEAMAVGCPVVVSGVASLPEVCGDATCYVDPHSVESIAGGLYRVVTDESLRRTLIDAGYRRVEMFPWSDSAKRHIVVFQALLKALPVIAGGIAVGPPLSGNAIAGLSVKSQRESGRWVAS